MARRVAVPGVPRSVVLPFVIPLLVAAGIVCAQGSAAPSPREGQEMAAPAATGRTDAAAPAAPGGSRDAAPAAPGGPDADASPAEPTIRYKLVVEGPDPPREALAEALDLARWQADEEMTLDLLKRLAQASLPQAREIAAIQGFYDAEAEVSIDENASPVVVTITIKPGPATRVRNVDVQVTGPATTGAPLGSESIEEAREGWRLEPGEVFRQADWLDAKDNALRTMHRNPYVAARIAASEARVDPGAQAADLAVTIDSGPPFHFGDLAIQGLKRYEPSVIENFNTIEPGEPHTQAAVDQFVRRLATTAYFSSVQASINPESPDPANATLEVNVIEGPTHRLDGAISYSTDTGFGGRASYTNVNLDKKALQMRVDVRLEEREQQLGAVFTWPPTATKWIHALTVGAERTDIENTRETTAGVLLQRRGVDERKQPVFTAQFVVDRQEPEGAEPISTYATYLEAGYVLRRVDDLLSPTRGYMIDARAGGGIPGVSTEGFGRVTAKWGAWWPIDRMTQLAFRGELGAVAGASRDRVPSYYLFRTGGDTTVRGYAYQSLGVQQGDAVVGGRYMFVASAEAIRWIRDFWGVAAFVDVGDAAESAGDLDPALGAGIGARIRTPIGPFRLDVAWGERTNSIRLHFSVGMFF